MDSAAQQRFVRPSWPAPRAVRAASTERGHGYSQEPFSSFNLGAHVGDDPLAVKRNRRRLRDSLGLPSDPLWLRQVHGTRVVDAEIYDPKKPADALLIRRSGLVGAVMTADCLPVLFCDRQATRAAVAHAGWRGLAAGVVEETVSALGTHPDDILAWIGPGIGADRFEVGEEVRDAFMQADSGAGALFRPSPTGRWLADLAGLARRRLQALGVVSVFGGSWCTFAESERFFSYRRETPTGRMATLIWIE